MRRQIWAFGGIWLQSSVKWDALRKPGLPGWRYNSCLTPYLFLSIRSFTRSSHSTLLRRSSLGVLLHLLARLVLLDSLQSVHNPLHQILSLFHLRWPVHAMCSTFDDSTKPGIPKAPSAAGTSLTAHPLPHPKQFALVNPWRSVLVEFRIKK
jgi:hypothetical protein